MAPGFHLLKYLLLGSVGLGSLLGACTPVEPLDAGSTPTGEAVKPTETNAPGVLQGKISFGPLQPVIRKDEPTPETPPELFEGRFVQIFQSDGETLVTQAAVTSDGNYRIELPPGDYVIGFTLVGIELAEGIPAEVHIRSGEVVTLDIAVDTGIR